jgi:Uncharacterized protein conserved in bacteria
MSLVSYEQALSRLAAYCSRSEKCLQDVKNKLDKWGVSSEDKLLIIQDLRRNKFLNEERYAFAFVRDKSRINGWGRVRITLELKRKNIPTEIIVQALNEISLEEVANQLIALLERKQKSIKAQNEFEARRKLMRFAAGRGFSLEDIERVMKKIKKQE